MKKKDDNQRRFSDLGQAPEDLSSEELNEIQSLYDTFMNDPDPEPSTAIDRRFYNLLESEKSREVRKRTLRPATRNILTGIAGIAAGIALFILGWFGSARFGSQQSGGDNLTALTEEIVSLRQTLILTMLDQSSPSERIRAVNMVSDMDDVSQAIIESMLSVLNNDPNDNVRLAALETLVNYAEYPEVRKGLVLSIKNQKSALIQIRLAEIMQSLQETDSVDEFRRILSDKTLDYSVRKQINETIDLLI